LKRRRAIDSVVSHVHKLSSAQITSQGRLILNSYLRYTAKIMYEFEKVIN